MHKDQPRGVDINSASDGSLTTPLPSSLPRNRSNRFNMVFKIGAIAALSIALSLFTTTFGRPAVSSLDKRWYFPSEIDLLSVTLQELQQFLSNGTVTSVQLTQRYLVSLLKGQLLDSANSRS
jgi:hypothetical protein